MSDSNREFHSQCFESIRGEPINLYTIPATRGNIGVGRLRGFHQGTAEFVSYVDDDDYIIPGIFEKCYEALDANPEVIGVFTLEQRLRDGILEGPEEIPMDRPWCSLVKHIHHLVVFRREQVMPYVEFMKDWEFGSEYMLLIELMAAGHKLELVNEVGYVWRLREDSAYRTMSTTEEQQRYIKEVMDTCDTTA